MALIRANRPYSLNLLARKALAIEDYTKTPGDSASPATPSPTSGSFPRPSATAIRTTASSVAPLPTETPESDYAGPTWAFEETTSISQSAAEATAITEASQNQPPASAMPEDTSQGFISKDPIRHDEHMSLSPVAQGLLATFSILGGLCLIAFLWLRYCRKKQSSDSHTQGRKGVAGLGLNLFSSTKRGSRPPATSPSSPSLEKRIAEPDSTHVPTYRITRASGKIAGWRAKSYIRGRISLHDKARMTMVSSSETVSDEETTTTPTPATISNPFEDPQLKKSYDMIHNRPRSTTLTDTGDWLRNPFEDPRDERFDPFGTLRERAQEEREKYLAILRAEREKHKKSNDEMNIDEAK
ncbi:hypothetical protein EJ05DRAFT_235813 [Pseudovirgaria hyperparasitica]|uniref:Uncharacterized protein n=1 Tax=Pseudovirgaria hyperparasitica TaxID=470096 RepID=A0A6A6VSW5_9PEZI|nr:uncharacterized protein EJ05DRAFT_235813 [Pseudovirgaria hyperparasitica]KAF2752876.1 hypothetical protein EJ05DRAFT_235813 [Pseudovirgaria hyperparasitica]